MCLTSGRSGSKRFSERGAAAVELALTLPIVALIVLGTLDFGYYFYVGVNATEAARMGIMQAVTTARTANAGGPIPNCANANTPAVITAAQTAAVAYMTTNMSATMAGYTTATVTCVAAPANPTWKIIVQVDFPPASGKVRAGLPPSAIAGFVRYRTPFMIRRLN